MFSGWPGIWLAGSLPCFFAGCMTARQRTIKAFIGFAGQSDLCPEVKRTKKRKRKKPAASASVLNIALRAGVFACRVPGGFSGTRYAFHARPECGLSMQGA